MVPHDANRNSSKPLRSYFQTDFARTGVKALNRQHLKKLIAAFGVLLLLSVVWHYRSQPTPDHSNDFAEKSQPQLTPKVAVESVAIPPAKPNQANTDTNVNVNATTTITQAAITTAEATAPATLTTQTVTQDPGFDTSNMERYTIKKGDNLSSIFKRLKLNLAELDELIRVSPETRSLRDLRPGQSLYLQRQNGDTQRLASLIFERSPRQQLIINRAGDTFHVETKIKVPDTMIRFASARIKDSLFMAGVDAGLDDKLIMELAALFGWDIDFALDIRPGDTFSVMYEEQYLDGIKVGSGPIIAAEFINRGKGFQAVRYTQSDGRTDYFTPEGMSMRKAFLRTPVNFTRISSRFSNGRKHPILHHLRAHRGVDYAAPRGTPVKASGDGKVVYVGRKGGYGKTVIIQHGQRYQTLYAHLNGYAKAARKGLRVRQGQVIGYVGSTGLATGPHLHYEFHVHGHHQDPLKVVLPKAHPIEEASKNKYLAKAQAVLTELRTHQGTQLAQQGN